MKFSERIGVVRRVLQKESIDDALKNSLWNIMYERFWKQHLGVPDLQASNVLEGALLLTLWADHLHLPADEAYPGFPQVFRQVKERYVAADWLEVYEFVEFVVDCLSPSEDTDQLIASFNDALEKHLSAYRFIGMTLAPITSEEEIAAVEQAMSHGGKFKPVVAHLETALARLADRSSPDYRNSIKESVSAVEAVCQIITGDPKATLGQALKKIGIHPALREGFSKIYGYASDADGIRHALLEESTVDADDAKFFLVSCSAFVNYLIAKSTGHDL